MNDPGLEEPIARSAKKVEHDDATHHGSHSPDAQNGNGRPASHTDLHDSDDEEDADYLTPSRWWFASTAFPLIAGTFGPMASAFNICALAPRWRVMINDGENEDDGDAIDDPTWLIAVNAVSLALALIANMALLMNMTRRIRFSIAQPITIIGWYLSSFLLIGLVVAAGYAPSFQMPDQNIALTQAFYYAIMSAALYIIISTLMVVTVYGAYKGHYPKDFDLTMSQRTLMLQTIAYLVYLLGGAAVYSRIENWLFLNAVYWANYTLLTIGIGDFHVMTHLGQSLLFPYAFGGIIILGLVVGSIRSLVLERGKQKLAARMVEKKREKVINKLDAGENCKARLSPFGPKVDLKEKHYPNEFMRRWNEFRVMRLIQAQADSRRKWTALLTSFMATLTLWLVGAAVFYLGERYKQNMTYFEAIYFAYTSLLTIGYGDYFLVANSSKAAFVLWSLLAIPTLTILISNMGDTIIKALRDLSLWVGSLTVLPGETSTKTRIKKIAHKAADTSLFNQQDRPFEEAPGGIKLPAAARDVEKLDHMDEGAKQGHAAVHLAKAAKSPVVGSIARVGDQRALAALDAATLTKSSGKPMHADLHFYHYMLIREIRRVIEDIREDPQKKYSYHEWAWFLRLLGDNEHDSSKHSRPPADPPKASDMQQAGAPVQSAASRAIRQAQTGEAPTPDDVAPTFKEVDRTGTSSTEAEAAPNKSSAENNPANGKVGDSTGSGNPGTSVGDGHLGDPITPWSWLGARSPLMGEQSEPEWVLDRLTQKLEDQLHGQRLQVPGAVSQAHAAEAAAVREADRSSEKQRPDHSDSEEGPSAEDDGPVEKSAWKQVEAIADSEDAAAATDSPKDGDQGARLGTQPSTDSSQTKVDQESKLD